MTQKLARRGRPPVPPELRKPPPERKNVSLEPDLVTALNTTADELATVFGFRPTLSQTVRWLITNRRQVPCTS